MEEQKKYGSAKLGCDRLQNRLIYQFDLPYLVSKSVPVAKRSIFLRRGQVILLEFGVTGNICRTHRTNQSKTLLFDNAGHVLLYERKAIIQRGVIEHEQIIYISSNRRLKQLMDWLSTHTEPQTQEC